MVMRVKGCSRLYKVSLLCMMICVICTLCIAFTGCGSTSGVPEEMPQTALVITDEGEVTYYLEADFDKDYYDITELEAMVQEDMQEYNAELSEKERAVLESIKLSADGQRAIVTAKFQNAAAYSRYSGYQLFYGTVSEAAAAGLDSGLTMQNAKDGSDVTQVQMKEHGNRKFLMAEEKARLYGPSRVLYISTGASYNEDGSVSPAEEGNTYMIMK